MKRPRVGIGVAAAVAIITAGFALYPMTTAQADTSPAADPTTGPRMLTGTLVDANGAPVPHAKLEVYTEDRSNPDVLADELIARGMTNTDGGFVIAGKLQHQVKLNPDQSIPLQVQVTTSDDMTKMFNLNAVPPTKPGDPWTWGNMVDEELMPDLTAAQADTRAHHAVDSITLDMTHAAPAPETLPGANRATGNSGDVQPADSGQTLADCMSHNWYTFVWVFNGNTEDRYVPLQKMDTQSRSTVKYSWSNSDRSQFQVAFNPAGAADPYGAGMDYSVMRASTDGISYRAGNDFHGVYSLNWRYRNYTEYCTNYEGINTQAEAEQYGVKTGDHKWMAARWLGGNIPVDHFDMFYCYSDVPPQPIYADTWVAKESSRRLRGYFSIIGVSLDASQDNHDNYYELHFTPDNPGVGAFICGSNSDPLHARLVRETNG